LPQSRSQDSVSVAAGRLGPMSAQPVEPGHPMWSPDLVRQRLGSYTVEDILALPDDAPRVELRDGVMFVVPSPTLGHQEVGTLLWLWLRNHAPREYRSSVATGVAIGIRETLEPDVLLLRSESFDLDRHFSTSDQVVLAVEVVAPGTRKRDRLEKPADYADAGIPYFWRIEQNPVHVYAYEFGPEGTYKLIADSDTELVLERPFEIRLPIGDITP
jgi:Uma2 family endonuclease